MSPARLHVRAVVVSDGGSPRLATVLDAVATQDPVPDFIELLLVGNAEAPATLPAHVSVHRVEASDLTGALRHHVSATAAAPGELLWLLHDDSAPEPGALGLLLATARKRHRAGVVGASQVQWDDPSRLVSMGITTTRGGARRLTLVEEGDIDQGQYNDRDDVLAVSLAGALVRREVWDHLDGLDPAYDGWGDSLDFCRRVWRAEWDVVVVPRARVRHAQESLNGGRGGAGTRRSTYGPRRAMEWYHALVYARWWMILPLLLASVGSALGRVVLRTAQNVPRVAGADAWVPVRVLALLPRLPRSRQRVARAGLRGTAARTVERPLLATPRQVRAETRSREWGAYESWRAAATPPELVRRELTHAARRRRLMLVAVAVAATVVAVLRHPDWVGGVFTGRMLASEALGVTDVGWYDLWARGLGGWTEQGLGAPAIDSGLSLLLLPLAFFPGGLAVGLGLLLTFLPLWSALGAWAAAGTLTRSNVVRALAALTYALAPFAVQTWDQGRIGAALVHVAVPWVVFGIIRGGGWHCGERIAVGEEFPAQRVASPSAAAGAATAALVAVLAAPVLWFPLVAGLTVLALTARRYRGRWWAVTLPVVIVGVPGLVAMVRQGSISHDAWTVMVREPGPSLSNSASALDTFLSGQGHVMSTASMVTDSWWSASALVVPAVLVVAVVMSFLGRQWIPSAVGVGMVVVGVVVGAASAATVVSPDLGAGTAQANGWAGPGLSIALMGAIIVIAAASRGLWDVGTGRTRAATRSIQGIAAASVAIVVVGHATAVAWPGDAGRDITAVSRDAIPLVAALELEQPTRQRVLILDDADDQIVASLHSSDGTDVVSTAGELVAGDLSAIRTSGVAVVGIDSLDETIAGLVGGAAEAPAQLAQWGIGVVVAAPGAERAVSALSQSDALQLLGSSDRGTSWKVARPDSDVPVSRAWVESASAQDDGSASVPLVALAMGRTSGTATLDEPVTGTVVVAVSDDDAWTATLNGRALDKVEDDLGRAAFAIEGSGELVVSFDDSGHRAWWWVSMLALMWCAIGAVPLPTRSFKEGRE
ncbi:glycosyltransferase [Demequina sp. B12]|uniref:glycosyltransferase n=1 Tax=Demequina sp. B12 TaxID=2992757 RepID=UPI00237B3CEA|nr:glycosyltransferase [Demequina sp. B12]MDE0573809.1 glycosyltransferase [Demequina sp. B12]